MPYIKDQERDVYAHILDNVMTELMSKDSKDIPVGHLNYLVSSILNDILEFYGTNYTNINALIGALECIKLEFYRRRAANYEDLKIEQNGDVYDV